MSDAQDSVQSPAANLESRARLFKALGHPTRLIILNLIESKPRHGQELAAVLNISPATVSHHLGQLVDVGLLRSSRDQYYQVYARSDALLERSLAEMIHVPQPGLEQRVERDAFRKKVLKSFMRHGRLTHIPAQLKKRRVILETLVESFEPARAYPEAEVNRILVEFYEDVATLRREMIGEGLMTRENGIYERV